jgi:hypothetical protein
MHIRSLAAAAAALVLTLSLSADAATPPRDVFEAEVVKVGTAPGFLCGGAAALQELDVKVKRASSGRYHAGDAPVLHVLTCFGGPLLRAIRGARAPVYELDPALVKQGSVIAFDVAPKETEWVETTEMHVITP